MSGVKAVFLDRDGTVVRDVGYLSDPGELEFIPGAADAVKMLNEAGFKVIVVSNQSGVARGLIEESRLADIHARLDEMLGEYGAKVDGYYYCPHHPEHGERIRCDCRKPGPEMANIAAREHGIDLARSYFVGDKMSDILLGKNAGGKTILVLTGYGEGERRRMNDEGVSPDMVVRGLAEAADWILLNSKES
jgi:D-glycero-D-manno-heptose 1,7-bisphosphate phosphatase